MTVADAKSMDRFAQPLVTDVRTFRGSPPAYSGAWQTIWFAQIDRVEINMGADSSTATLAFPNARWDARSRLRRAGTMVRIRTVETVPTVVFQGFITAFSSSFSGGRGSGGQFAPAHEANACICSDYRWLLAVTSPLSGQVARGPDDYDNYTTSYETPKWGVYPRLPGRRPCFIPEGRPNMVHTPLRLTDGNYSIPIFAPPDSPGVEYWTARDMIHYCLSPLVNYTLDYMPIFEDGFLRGLSDDDFDAVLSNITVEGLNVVEALDLICRHIGWSFREDYFAADDPRLVFFKPGAAEGHTRVGSRTTIVHNLHAPTVGDSVLPAVAAGAKMLWSMVLRQDIANVVNTPWGNGAPDRFEITAELVPAWNDTDHAPDTSDDNANLFFTDADLQEMNDPNMWRFYRNYHCRGSANYRYHNVGRQWSLNETGHYSLPPFSRGQPFDFSAVIHPEYILDSDGKRCFARFPRQFLPCLTIRHETLNSVGIHVEFSLNDGSTWQVIPCSIRSLPNECGIYISEPNLCEMVDQNEATISGGVLDGVQLNYYTSLADDILNTRPFGSWRTRCRVTASVQTDRRIAKYTTPTSSFTSPFRHRRLYDFPDKYGLALRTPSSVFYPTLLNADEFDLTDRLNAHLDAIRDASQDASLSGLFVLERLWLGDGTGRPDFLIGDGIAEITGRDISLAGKVGDKNVYPEIVRILYSPAEQKMQLITRDLRFTEAIL